MHCKSHLRDGQKGKRGVRRSRTMSIGIAILIGLSALFVLHGAHQGLAEPLKQSNQQGRVQDSPMDR